MAAPPGAGRGAAHGRPIDGAVRQRPLPRGVSESSQSASGRRGVYTGAAAGGGERRWASGAIMEGGRQVANFGAGPAKLPRSVSRGRDPPGLAARWGARWEYLAGSTSLGPRSRCGRAPGVALWGYRCRARAGKLRRRAIKSTA